GVAQEQGHGTYRSVRVLLLSGGADTDEGRGHLFFGDWLAQGLWSLRIPHLHLTIRLLLAYVIAPGGGGEAPAVGAEAHALDPASVLAEGEEFLPGPGVPQLYRVIFRSGGQAGAVGAEADAPDRVGVTLEVELLLTGLGVPYLRRARLYAAVAAA